MIGTLRDLVRHKGHANAALLSAVTTSATAAADPEIGELLHHILLANGFWHATIFDLPFALDEARRSSRALPALVDGFRQLQTLEEDRLDQASEADLQREVTGPQVPGGRCRVSDALLQVCMHSLGHRSQCATLLRRHGVVPPTSDFIFWLVERPAARWP